jgi:hypothetical protein
MPEERTGRKEEFRVSGGEVIDKIKEIIHEGTARRIILKNEQDHIIMEIPVTFALVGVVLLPIIAAVGAAAAMLTRCTIVVERKEDEVKHEDPETKV